MAEYGRVGSASDYLAQERAERQTAPAPVVPKKLTNARVDRTTTITLSGTKLTVLELHELLEEFNDEDVISISVYQGGQLDSTYATFKVTKQK